MRRLHAPVFRGFCPYAMGLQYSLLIVWIHCKHGLIFFIAHAIIAGNEDCESWTAFFEFVCRVFPSLDDHENTIVSDRDKGLIKAFSKTFDNAHGFHCSMHRHGKIVGRYGKAVGEVYMRCIRALSVPELDRIKRTAVQSPEGKVKDYFLSVSDEQLFPCSRTANGEFMYGRSTNGISEAMNSANMRARVQGMDMFRLAHWELGALNCSRPAMCLSTVKRSYLNRWH